MFYTSTLSCFQLFFNWLFKVARFYLGVIFHRPQNWITLHKLSVAVAYIHRSRLATFLLSCLWKREQLPPIFLRLTTKRSNFADSVLQRIPQKCLFDSILRQMNESWKLHFILFCCWMRKFIHISPRKVVNDNLSYLFHIVFFSASSPPFHQLLVPLLPVSLFFLPLVFVFMFVGELVSVSESVFVFEEVPLLVALFEIVGLFVLVIPGKRICPKVTYTS